MNALSPLFLWLLPLALLPVVIHLLNRLRYQTVKWAAMMFLRSADRDASRRARIRQWIILAARCLMLLFFITALARLQSKGRLARFLDPGADLVVILFDRSPSMEMLRGGVSGRERALSLLNQGVQELGPETRLIWIDSAQTEALPLPSGVDLSRLPVASATSRSSDMGQLVRRALEEIERAQAGQAEIWIPTDRQKSAWMPQGVPLPEWGDWEAMAPSVTFRVLNVGEGPADPGNRSLSLTSPPVVRGDVLRVGLTLTRDTDAPAAIPLQVDRGGLSLREEVMVTGTSFQWDVELPLAEPGKVTHARIALPADANARDNEVVVAWSEPDRQRVGSDIRDDSLARILRASVLPVPGSREWMPASGPAETMGVWVTVGSGPVPEPLRSWVASGGVLVRFPEATALEAQAEGAAPLTVDTWVELNGVLATRGREALRLDLLEVTRSEVLEDPGDGQVLAWLSDGSPFLTRRPVGQGAVYQWATRPVASDSNLDDGFVLVPVMQRFLEEAAAASGTSGLRDLTAGIPGGEEGWVSLDGPDRSPGLDVGRFRRGEDVLAFNRARAEDATERIAPEDLQTWADPFEVRVFEDTSAGSSEEAPRSEFTGLLAVLGLSFLVVESWLLTRNIRRTPRSDAAWGRAAA